MLLVSIYEAVVLYFSAMLLNTVEHAVPDEFEQGCALYRNGEWP
jgi:hypothetical protein